MQLIQLLKDAGETMRWTITHRESGQGHIRASTAQQLSTSCRLVVHVSEQNVRNMSFEGSTSFSETCAQSPEQWSWIGICPRVPEIAGPPVLPNSFHKLEQNNWLPMDFVLFSKQCILFQMTPNCAILPNILPSLPSHTYEPTALSSLSHCGQEHFYSSYFT